MPSREYQKLKKNICALKGHFLDFKKRLDGRYTRYELAQCRAFITFCHSEFEIYLETASGRAVERAEKNWKRTGRTTRVISAMLAYRLNGEVSLPDDPPRQAQRSKLDTLIGHAISRQKSAIKGNHGIRPRNLAELFIPIGMKPDQFEDPLLVQLKNLGERRGDQVHQDSQVSLPRIRDPFDDELRDVEFLLSEIEPFDRLAAKLK